MVLLLILSWACVWGKWKHSKFRNGHIKSIFSTGMPHFKVEEGHNLDLKRDYPRSLNLSALSIDCHFLSKSLLIFQMDSGEVRSSERVQCDREALKEGRVQLVFTHLRARDSGKYMCDMSAEESGSWKLTFYEYFVIDVLPAESTTAATTPGVQSGNAVTKQTESHEGFWGGLCSSGTALLIGLPAALNIVSIIVSVLGWRAVHMQNSNRDYSTMPPPDHNIVVRSDY